MTDNKESTQLLQQSSIQFTQQQLQQLQQLQQYHQYQQQILSESQSNLSQSIINREKKLELFYVCTLFTIVVIIALIGIGVYYNWY
jgi:hypothetical protein